MSFVYLNSLKETEYNDLVNKLYDIQNGVCFICGKKIENPHINIIVTSIKNRAKFHIEDYALCHKACDSGSVRDDILIQAIENDEFITPISIGFETPNIDGKEIKFDTDYMSFIDELEKQIIEERKQERFWKKEEKIFKALAYYDNAREHKGKKKYKYAITALEKATAIIQDINCTVYPEIHSCLIDCYARIKDTENQIRVIKLAIELYNHPQYTRMLKRINGTEKECVLIKDSYHVVAKCNYGEMYDKHIKEHLPEFNFYYNNFNPFRHYDFEKDDMLPVIRIIDKHFQTTLKKAERAEMAEFYDEAVELYEQLIAEGIYTQTAYERLIIIYSKAKRKKDLIRILKTGINFFETRKSLQTEYVRSLAKKYNAEDYCEMCIKTGKKIRYYCGYIVLYQDYPFIETWKKRLAKLLD